MKSCNAKRRGLRTRTARKSIGLIGKKKHFTLAAHFFGHFFDVVLHDYNIKLRSYTSYVGNVVCAHQKLAAYVSVRFFFFLSVPLIFTLLVARISHLLTANSHVLLPTKFVSFVFYLTL